MAPPKTSGTSPESPKKNNANDRKRLFGEIRIGKGLPYEDKGNSCSDFSFAFYDVTVGNLKRLVVCFAKR